jgi:hypothetical protein
MTLPEPTLLALPTPKAFQKLSEDIQQNIRSIYYSKRYSFEEKLKAMEDVIHGLPPEQLKLIPIQNEIPGLVEFDVPVLLQFNGQIVSIFGGLKQLGCSKKKKISPNFYSLPMMLGSNLKRREESRCLVDVFGGC